MTAEQYAPAVMQAGRDLGVSPKGIVIGFATVYVEADWLMYANQAVPDSMSLPHDAVGSDSYSVGLFQQQVVWGNSGWWWADAATCMNPYQSARLFFERLARLDYNSDAQTPGSYAQAVQGSAYPDRYDQRMGDAQALYDQITSSTGGSPVAAAVDPNRPDFNQYPLWCNNSQSRAGTKPDLWLIHTEEGTMNADALARWMATQQVSYHRTISEDPNDHGVTVCDVVNTDLASWSVMNSNDRAINLCFAGSYSSWTRDEWLNNQSRAIDVAAYLCVQDCIKYGIPPNVIAPPYTSDPPGIADHRYCSVYLRDGNNHTDVDGNGPYGPPYQKFPWDFFAAAVAKYWNLAQGGQPVPTPDPTPAPAPAPVDPTAPTDPEAEILAQTRGRWGRLGGRTLVEAIGLLIDKATGEDNSKRTDFSW